MRKLEEEIKKYIWLKWLEAVKNRKKKEKNFWWNEYEKRITKKEK